MKFIVSSNYLLKNLQSISGVASSSNTLPILDDFLFEIRQDILHVTASDLETTMTVSLKLTMSEEEGSIAVPAKILLDTLKTLADVPITFTINNDTYAIEMTAGGGKYKLSGHNGEEFPETPTVEEGSSFTIKSTILSEAISKTVFAAGNDEIRPVMSGVLMELTDEGMALVATDAHKLVRYARKDVVTDNYDSIILPTKPLNQIKNILGNEELDVKVEYNDKNAFFAFGNIQLLCKLIVGKYPNYPAVIPVENPNKLQISRSLLLNTIKRVSLFANQSTHQIRFKISGQQLELSAEDIDYSNEAVETISCNYDGEDLEIGFNSKFMQEMLNNVDTKEVLLKMSQPNRAGLIIPVEEEPQDNEEILMLVMPVMLNS
ncbi:MAG: DNA polymerase III subunit beta [Bacteroidales bacterium]|jgi:DNA polymerase-3 subunit beta|nr:DNA polymerase III subunit beta [Bacteroidales bacterium]MDD3527111.1 DNA polymerase III subunit beta [Bacteroidales bacterium]NCU36993.1 DNA polymerase III subunit beta [Candidatus Falkowbacteria bacterium]